MHGRFRFGLLCTNKILAPAPTLACACWLAGLAIQSNPQSSSSSRSCLANRLNMLKSLACSDWLLAGLLGYSEQSVIIIIFAFLFTHQVGDVVKLGGFQGFMGDSGFFYVLWGSINQQSCSSSSWQPPGQICCQTRVLRDSYGDSYRYQCRQVCSSHHKIVIWICFWFCILSYSTKISVGAETAMLIWSIQQSTSSSSWLQPSQRYCRSSCDPRVAQCGASPQSPLSVLAPSW